MRNKQNNYKQLSLKLGINALSICFLSLIALPINAADNAAKQAAAAAAAAMSAGNVGNNPEVVVDEIPAEVKAAVETKLASKIEISALEIDPVESQVFRAPIYNVEPLLGYIAVVDGEVLDLNNPRTNTLLPDYLKLIRDDFVLDSEDKALLLASAFEPIFPNKLDKIVGPVKVDHGWIVFRGDFFGKYVGLVFTTDEKGKIILLDYVLKIDPEDYSYEPSQE